MRFVGMVSTAVVLVVLGSSVPAYCQHGRQQDRRDRHEDKAEREKPARQNHPDKRAYKEHERSDRRNEARERAAEPHRPQRTVRVEHVRPAPRHVARYEHRVVWQQHRAHEWRREHRTWIQRGGYHGYRIPRDRFVMYFGRAHRYRVHTLPVMVVEGRPRFQCHGFWFAIVDPWPESWATNWYETDDVYIDYVNDGYYMYNARHPGVAIAINISL